MFLICRVVTCLSGVSTHPHSLLLFCLWMPLVASLAVMVGHAFCTSLVVCALFSFIIVIILLVIMFSL